jgi:hypothetical protein
VDREAVDDFLRTADAILDDDWEVSDDAMRWTPQEQREETERHPTGGLWDMEPDSFATELIELGRRVNEYVERQQYAWARSWAGPMRYVIDTCAETLTPDRAVPGMDSEPMTLPRYQIQPSRRRYLNEPVQGTNAPVEQAPEERPGMPRAWSIFDEAPNTLPPIDDYHRAIAEMIARVPNADYLGVVPVIEMSERARPADDITDPRERALYLRRTRNTGPQQQRRAPRRIDARRGRN